MNDNSLSIIAPQDLRNYVNFNLGVMRSGDMCENVFVTGFGGSGKSNDNVTSSFIGVRTTGMGSLYFDNPYNNYFINYDADEVGGDSGGPVWVNNSDGTRTVIGINAYECYTYYTDANNNDIPIDNLYNSGVRINTNILHAIFDNNHLAY